MHKAPGKRCGIIGSKGQDGQLLSNQLTKKGHYVSGIARGDLNITIRESVESYLREARLDELYYLVAYHSSSEDRAAISDAEIFQRSFAINVQGLVTFLDGIRRCSPQTRLFYAASSHVFGNPEVFPQNESTPFRPNNIYGISKAAGIEACGYYRKNYRLFAASGILYNHESALRSEKFVAKKIIHGALRILREEQDFLTLGNLDAAVDWGYAGDYTEAMALILSQPSPDDYVIATGTTHMVRELVDIVFTELGLNWRDYVKTDASILTKSLSPLVGDASKLRSSGWKPTMDFPSMVKSILRDVQKAESERPGS